MKKITYTLILLFLANCSWAQYDGLTFQALVLDTDANPIVNANTIVRVSITDTTQTQTIVYYEEEQDLVTSENGTIAFNVGEGTPLQGSMSDVDWLAGVPYVQIAYNLMDGKGWHQIVGHKFHAVPFCLQSRFVVCQDGRDGIPGITGPAGPNGINGTNGLDGAIGPDGSQGIEGISFIDRLSTPPDNPQEGRVYLDDGSNRADTSPGFRYYNGNVWIDL